ncbi:MAG: hypothetical protein ACE5DI_05665 [Candidatus Micrarchaeia archaeon]
MKIHSASAGSFVTGREISQAREKGLVTFVHFGGKASCGGGNALSESQREKTSDAVRKFLTEKIGVRENAAEQVKLQLQKMHLDASPEAHAKLIKEYNQKTLGIEKNLALTHNLENGKIKVVAKSGTWTAEEFKNSVKVSCADARHKISLDEEKISELLEKNETTAKGEEQKAQNPNGFLFNEGPVTKQENVFTIIGISPQEFKQILSKMQENQSTDVNDAHSVAAAALSAYYYTAHRWQDHEKLLQTLKINAG